jgi:multiple sugar transport system substrate-binding protein
MKFRERGRTMRLNIRDKTFIRRGAAVAAVSLLAVAGGTASTAAASKAPTVTINVAALIPGSTAAALTEFNNQVAQFEKQNPTIKVYGVQYDWTGPTFAAELAAGTLPDVFTVPFTDGRSLGENGQLANLTSYVKKLPYFKEFNPAVIAEGTDAKGQVIAIPTAAYAQALQYNRQLFSEAGLNPNDPPKTWAQVEADAKAITQKTGMTGFSEMGANDNTAGWILTTLDYALGGRMETGVGTKAKANFDNPQAVQALQILHTMRWTDNDMGSNFGLSWGTSNQAFAAGQIGMYVSGSDVYTNMVQADNINPSIYGLAPIPLANNKNAGVLGGGTLAAVKPTASPAQIAAAMKWITFYYMEPLVNKQAAIRNAQTLVASKQPVGVPELPIFNEKQYQTSQTWIAPYINVPLNQLAPFNSGIFKEKVIPEPEASTQAIYGDLDSVVEAVLTDPNANIQSLLQQANTTGQASIDSGS